MSAWLLVVMITLVSVRSETPENVQDLLDDLLYGENRYNKMIRGELDLTKAMTVKMGLSLISIDNLDEVRETLDLLAVMYLEWTDQRLKWEPENYNDTREIQVDHDKVWMPMIVLANPSTDIKAADTSGTFVWLDNSGRASWRTASIFKVKCPADFTSFPFDLQSCGLLFHAWGYTQNHVRLIGMSEKMHTQNFSKNGLWRLHDTHVRTKKSVQHLEFMIELERHSLFYIVNICVPAVLFGILSVFGVLIPHESGERISYSITVLLSIAVFLNLVGDILPANSVKMPSICYFILSQLGASFVSSLCSVLSLKMYHSDDRTPPCWLAKMVTVLCPGRHTQIQSRNINNVKSSPCILSVSKEHHEECFIKETHIETDTIKDITLQAEPKRRDIEQTDGNVFENESNVKESADEATWRDVCFLFDRLTLIFLPSFLVLSVSMYSYYVVKGRNIYNNQ